MKASKTSKQWMNEHVNDPYVQRAQKEGYRSRAAYKLLEIDERDHLIKPGMVVVDLGATPGGWCQVVAQKLGDKGRIIALDLLPLQPLPRVEFIQGDFREDAVLAELRVEQVTEKERKRIAADLHDDLGAKLLTIVHTSESDRISSLAREALEEIPLELRRRRLRASSHVRLRSAHQSGQTLCNSRHPPPALTGVAGGGLLLDADHRPRQPIIRFQLGVMDEFAERAVAMARVAPAPS